MANPGQGHKSYVQIGAQAAYDTPDVATQKLEFVNEAARHETDEIPDPSLYDGRSPREIIDGPQWAEGPIRHRLNYDGLNLIYRAAMGGYSQSFNGTVRTHLFPEGDPLMLTREIVKGEVTAAGKCFQHVGCKTRSLVFDFTAGQPGFLDVDYLGKDLIPDIDVTSALSFPAVLPILAKQAIKTDDGTLDSEANIRIRSVKVTHTIPLTEDRDAVGLANRDEPLPANFRSTVWEIQQEFKTLSAYNAARARTVGALDFLYRHPTDLGSSNFRELRLYSPECKGKYSAPVEGYGVLIATATWVARHVSAIGGAFRIEVKNTEAALP